MGKRLFIGNLSYNTTASTLRSLFDERGWGVDDVVIVTDRESGRSRGFGFVELTDERIAAEVMAALDGFDLDGRNLTVREAHERTRRRGPPRQDRDFPPPPMGDDFGDFGGEGGGGKGRRSRRERGERKRHEDEDEDW